MKVLGVDFFKKATIEEIRPGEGGVVNIEGQKAAVFKGKDGKIKMVSAKCTHLGCTVHWDKERKGWDCPCHGSKFDVDGKVIHGPAIKDLEKV